METTVDLGGGTGYLDVEYGGIPRLIACGVVETPAGLLLVDPGPTSSLDGLLKALDARGNTLSDVAAILLTHIHLDHAGATGTLVGRNRNIRVFVHGRGARHLIDPSRLLASARRIYGERLDELWGEIVPVPDDNVEVVSHGDLIAPGGRDIDVAYTPGHAVHHVSYFDRATSTAFVGDTLGLRVEGEKTVIPMTPPPDIDLVSWQTSVQKISDWSPKRLVLTHFGRVDEPAAHIARFTSRLNAWSERARELWLASSDARTAAALFGGERLDEIRSSVDQSNVSRYETFGDPVGSYFGLARHFDRQQRT